MNDDKNTHCAVLPSNGDTQFLWLVNHSKGTATLELDGPGYYWYGSHRQRRGPGPDRRDRRGRGRPAEARLDRPPQPRPTVADRPDSRERSNSMATEYVDAGHAVSTSTLSDVAGKAPPVAKGVTLRPHPQRP